MQQVYSLLPHLKITGLLLSRWLDRLYPPLQAPQAVPRPTINALLTAVLADRHQPGPVQDVVAPA